MTFDALTLDGLQRILADVHERENEAWRKINAELRKTLENRTLDFVSKIESAHQSAAKSELHFGGDGI